MARILVIDDQEDIRSVVKQLLSLEGYEVDVAKNGLVGLKLFRLEPYDLVITDVVMPEEDGLGVVMALKQQFPPVKIIVMTGGGVRVEIGNTLKTAKLLGADRVLPKPLDFIQLRTDVKEVLAIEK